MVFEKLCFVDIFYVIFSIVLEGQLADVDLFSRFIRSFYEIIIWNHSVLEPLYKLYFSF